MNTNKLTSELTYLPHALSHTPPLFLFPSLTLSLLGPTHPQTVYPFFSLHAIHCEDQTCDAPLILIQKHLISTACMQAIN